MNSRGLAAILKDLDKDHQVNRIIQLDRKTGYAFIPTTIMLMATSELIFKGSVSESRNTKPA